MKRLLSAGALAVLALLLPSQSRAVPLDVPYQVLVDSTNNTGTLIISTNAFSSTFGTTSQWCVSHLTITSSSAASFTMYWSTGSIAPGTTDYMVTTAANTPYDTQWASRNPYCAPTGDAVLTLKSSVATSTITVEGYLFKGWNP